jgi:hypothetical protein
MNDFTNLLVALAALWLMVYGISVTISGVWPQAGKWYLKTSQKIVKSIVTYPFRAIAFLLTTTAKSIWKMLP